MMHFRVTAQVGMADVEAAPITIVRGEFRPFPSADLTDNIHLMPAPGDDLAAALRRLADRVDEAMAAVDTKAVA